MCKVCDKKLKPECIELIQTKSQDQHKSVLFSNQCDKIDVHYTWFSNVIVAKQYKIHKVPQFRMSAFYVCTLKNENLQYLLIAIFVVCLDVNLNHRWHLLYQCTMAAFAVEFEVIREVILSVNFLNNYNVNDDTCVKKNRFLSLIFTRQALTLSGYLLFY